MARIEKISTSSIKTISCGINNNMDGSISISIDRDDWNNAKSDLQFKNTNELIVDGEYMINSIKTLKSEVIITLTNDF